MGNRYGVALFYCGKGDFPDSFYNPEGEARNSAIRARGWLASVWGRRRTSAPLPPPSRFTGHGRPIAHGAYPSDFNGHRDSLPMECFGQGDCAGRAVGGHRRPSRDFTQLFSIPLLQTKRNFAMICGVGAIAPQQRQGQGDGNEKRDDYPQRQYGAGG